MQLIFVCVAVFFPILDRPTGVKGHWGTAGHAPIPKFRERLFLLEVVPIGVVFFSFAKFSWKGRVRAKKI